MKIYSLKDDLGYYRLQILLNTKRKNMNWINKGSEVG